MKRFVLRAGRSPACQTLGGISHTRKTPKIKFEIIPIFGMFAKISFYE